MAKLKTAALYVAIILGCVLFFVGFMVLIIKSDEHNAKKQAELDHRYSTEFEELRPKQCVNKCMEHMMKSFHGSSKQFLGGAHSSSMGTAEAGIWNNVKSYCEDYYTGEICAKGHRKAISNLHDPECVYSCIGLVEREM